MIDCNLAKAPKKPFTVGLIQGVGQESNAAQIQRISKRLGIVDCSATNVRVEHFSGVLNSPAWQIATDRRVAAQKRRLQFSKTFRENLLHSKKPDNVAFCVTSG
jgi:hypothetical protein